VSRVRALTGAGLPELWQEIERHHAALAGSGEFAAKRRRQQVSWMWSMLEARLLAALRADPDVRALLPGLVQAVADGAVTASLAVERVLAAFGADQNPKSERRP
jgi:LAO/AO transport system kinase